MIMIDHFVLTDFTPIKLKIGFARNMRKIVWRRPRMQPMRIAVEADGICRFTRLILPLL